MISLHNKRSVYGIDGWPQECQRRHLDDATADNVVDRAKKMVDKLQREVSAAEAALKRNRAELKKWEKIAGV